MEVGPNVEFVEVVPEQHDFLEVYADREVTLFGITGTLGDLAGMCPVDLSDPRVTLEAKNDFVIKAANESGMEIAPEHEDHFARVIEKFGHERKFTIAEPQPRLFSPPERPKLDTDSHEIAKTRVLQAERDHVEPQLYKVAEQRDKLTAAETLAPFKEEAIAPNAGSVAVMELRLRPAEQPVAVHSDSDAAGPTAAQLIEQKQEVARVFSPAAAVYLKPADTVHLELQPFQLLAESDAEPLLMSEALSLPDSRDEPSADPLILELDDLDRATGSTQSVSWEAVPQDEQIVGYDALINTLLSLTGMQEAEDHDNEELLLPPIGAEEGVWEPMSEVAPQSEPMPAIALVVTERLGELVDNEKESISPLLQQTMEALDVVRMLQTTEGDPVEIELAMIQLEQQVANVFEYLAIEYKPEDIKCFVNLLLRAAIQPLSAPDRDVFADIEHQGTHEIKRQFSQLVAGGLTDVEYQAERLLGSLMLFGRPLITGAGNFKVITG